MTVVYSDECSTDYGIDVKNIHDFNILLYTFIDDLSNGTHDVVYYVCKRGSDINDINEAILRLNDKANNTVVMVSIFIHNSGIKKPQAISIYTTIYEQDNNANYMGGYIEIWGGDNEFEQLKDDIENYTYHDIIRTNTLLKKIGKVGGK